MNPTRVRRAVARLSSLFSRRRRKDVWRAFLSHWSVADLLKLLATYESLLGEYEIQLEANAARPSRPNLCNHLQWLYDTKFNTDVVLIFDDVSYAVHRAILCAKCQFFRTRVADVPKNHCCSVTPQCTQIDQTTFSGFLKFLYNDEIPSSIDAETFHKLCDEFGYIADPKVSYRWLLESSSGADASLHFQGCKSGCRNNGSLANTFSEPHYINDCEVACHSAVLAARSNFFKRIISRRMKESDMRIQLDECVVPRKYVHVLLKWMYSGHLELSAVMRNNNNICSLSQVESLVQGGGPVTAVEEAQDMFQMGEFLELPVLCQACEDVIVNNLSLDCVLQVFEWSDTEAPWVNRQCLYFLYENFSSLLFHSTLQRITPELMEHLIQCDFLQAPEAEILDVLLQWRTYRVAEPNIVSHTLTRVQPANIFKCIRTDHILPVDYKPLLAATKQGILNVTPLDDVTSPGDGSSSSSVSHKWDISRWTGLETVARPRLFLPYYSILKHLLHSKTGVSTVATRNPLNSFSFKFSHSARCSLPAASGYPNSCSQTQMELRLKQLLRQTVTKQVAASAGDEYVLKWLKLRVLREFGLAETELSRLDGVLSVRV